MVFRANSTNWAPRPINYTLPFHGPEAMCWLAVIIYDSDRATFFVSHFQTWDGAQTPFWARLHTQTSYKHTHTHTHTDTHGLKTSQIWCLVSTSDMELICTIIFVDTHRHTTHSHTHHRHTQTYNTLTHSPTDTLSLKTLQTWRPSKHFKHGANMYHHIYVHTHTHKCTHSV